MDSSWKLKKVCKRDVYHYLNIDNEVFHNAPIAEAGFLIFQRDSRTINFVEKWLDLCLDERLITDKNFCGLEQLSGFTDHRGDMPLLLLQRIFDNIEGRRIASQWGNHLKLREFRIKGEFLTDGRYWEEELWINSPYGTILTYDKEGTIVRAH
jgi:hypothetical protein